MGARPKSFAGIVTELPVTHDGIEGRADVVRVWSEAQQGIFQWFAHLFEGHPDDTPPEGKSHLVVRARAGCICGDVDIAINRQGKGWSLSLRELVAKFNGNDSPIQTGRLRISRKWDSAFPTFVQQERDGVVRLTRIVNAWCSGWKQTYTVVTREGRTIRATDEHPFLTSDGWRRLDQLRPGMSLHVRGEQRLNGTAPKKQYPTLAGMWHHPFAARNAPDKTHRYGLARVPLHRLVAEAHRNNLSLEIFLTRVYNDNVEELEFLDPAVWTVHHKDRNPTNNAWSNLEVLTNEEHKQLHAREGTDKNVAIKIAHDAVRSVTPYGFEETFDIEVDNDGPRNFLAGGIVVHNTGKTTTIVEGVRRAPEDFILVCAFNKRIADELSERLKDVPSAEARTLHSLGLQMIRREWRRMPVCERDARFARADQLTDRALAGTERQRGEKTPRIIRNLISQLHGKGREMLPLDFSEDTLTKLAFRFDLVPDENWRDYDLDYVVTHALAAMHDAASIPPTYDVGVDHADMLFLPLVWNLTARDYQLVVMDESQDANRARLEMAKRVCSGRICMVGDDKQAIYLWNGAVLNALDEQKRELQAVELPLTTTYRCCKAVVREAQKLVPDIQAGPTNPEGEVRTVDYDEMMREAKAGDVILSRINAPLVTITLKLAQHGKRAKMAGRDIGDGILKILTKLKPGDWATIGEVIDRIQQWEHRQTSKLAAYGQNDLVEKIRDQAAMLLALAEDDNVRSYADLARRIDYLFTDDHEDGEVLCSSVHKAKGLEWDRVWLLMGSLYRRGTSPEECNIHYVAVTRAKSSLMLVETGLSPRLRGARTSQEIRDFKVRTLGEFKPTERNYLTAEDAPF